MTTTTAPTEQAAGPQRLRDAWVPLTALALAFFVEMVDNTIMNLALPSMARDLGAGTTQMQWITGAYSLVFGSLLLATGSAADRFGRRRLLIGALFLFGAISALVWFVHTPGELIAMRALLGVAAAGMAPVTMSLVFRLFDDDVVRMRAINVMIVVGMSSMALGPLLAGAALTHVSWHWLLFVNTPVALIATLGVLMGIDRDRPEDLRPEPLDLPAVALTMLGIGMLCYTMTAGVEHGWTSGITLACALAAVASLAAFVWREATAKHPMIDLHIMANRTVSGSALAQAGSSVAMIASMFLLSMHLQFAMGWTPLQAGLGNLPFFLTMLVATPVSEKLTIRYGHRVTCMIAAALLTVGLVELAWAAPHGYWPLVPGIVIMTVGLRIIMTVCAIALIESVPEEQTSLGTALNDVVQEVGSSLGVALVGTMIAALVTKALPADAWEPALQASFFDGERVIYGVLAVIIGVVVGYGASTLTNSHTADEH
ncbi:MFS transporter [Corynebacterium sp. UBA2622]|uniref:MFS transporter n=1 Tax=Corynebacterium sp. UBA2622 TaxID=1946393 RepID=UPI0025B891FA|nr:MFS transporter [Corynebacterium sp. UBA2622]